VKKKTKQRLVNGCLAAAVAFSTTLIPMADPGLANAATPNALNSVTRIGGYDQYETAALIAQKGWAGTSDNVVLSSGMNYALVDALAAGPLAAQLKAPILLTDNGQTLSPAAKAELLRLKPKTVFLTSGTAVIKSSVLEELKAMGITPVQLGGFDQYETSVNIAKEMANQGMDISQVVLAAGWLTPADALSIAPIAAAQGTPILTTTKDQLPASVQTYLDSLKTQLTDSYVMGGTAVVSDAVKAALPGQVSRYYGETKYDTNLQILKSFAKDYKNDQVYVANGETLVDALSGVTLAAANGAPVLLVNQQLDTATKDFVKLNLSTTDMVALGGEVVVPSSGLADLTSAVMYTTDGATLGSSDPEKLAELTDSVQILGDNITFANAQADYSVYVKGDNITLTNVNVKGTVFVDPGDTGSATLDGVTAANIVILSGASDSIHLKNTKANVLTVDSSSNVHVDATGETAIGNTVVRTFAIVDANGGSIGVVTISSTPGQSPVVELRGTFTQDIVVAGNVTLKAAPDAVIPRVVVSTENPAQKVTLDGKFKAVQQTLGKVALAPNSTVDTLKATTKTEITIPVGSSIGSLDTGNTGTLVGGGGKANGETTSVTPVVPPTTPTTPTTPPSTGGGGGGGGGTDTPTPTTPAPTVSSIKSATSGATIASISGNQIAITPIGSAFKEPNIIVDQNSAMTIKVTRSGQDYNLGTWNLTNAAQGNDIFSVSNATNLNILETFEILKATGIKSSEIFEAIDFQAILTAAQAMTPTNKNQVYTSTAAIFDQAKNTSSANAFYTALNLPDIYAAADSTTQGTLHTILAEALPTSAGVSADALLNKATSAAAVATLNNSGEMSTFFNNLEFQRLFNALSASSQKDAIFTAVNFTALFDAFETLPSINKTAVYLNAAFIYQAAITIQAGSNAINYGAILQLVMTSPNTVTMTLTNTNGTTQYTVVKGS